MTDKGSEDTQQEYGPETVGEILKAAREKHALDRQEVADQLHLRPSIIKAIEQGDYQSTPGELFLKGYVRSYARLTEQDGDDLVRRLDFELIPLRREEREQEPSATEIIRRRKERRRRLGGALIALISVAVVLWVAIQHGPWVATRTFELIEEPPQEEDGDREPAASGADNTSSGGDEAAESRQEVDAPGNGQGDTPENATGSLEGVAAVGEILADARNADAGATEPVAKETTAETASLWIQFEQACWVEVVNGNDERVVVRLAKAGETLEYAGPGPLEVLLGNVEAVTGIRFGGEPVDLDDYPASSGRTQFVLGSSGAG